MPGTAKCKLRGESAVTSTSLCSLLNALSETMSRKRVYIAISRGNRTFLFVVNKTVKPFILNIF